MRSRRFFFNLDFGSILVIWYLDSFSVIFLSIGSVLIFLLRSSVRRLVVCEFLFTWLKLRCTNDFAILVPYCNDLQILLVLLLNSLRYVRRSDTLGCDSRLRAILLLGSNFVVFGNCLLGCLTLGNFCGWHLIFLTWGLDILFFSLTGGLDLLWAINLLYLHILVFLIPLLLLLFFGCH